MEGSGCGMLGLAVGFAFIDDFIYLFVGQLKYILIFLVAGLQQQVDKNKHFRHFLRLILLDAENFTTFPPKGHISIPFLPTDDGPNFLEVTVLEIRLRGEKTKRTHKIVGLTVLVIEKILKH